jgi:ribonuclease HI
MSEDKALKAIEVLEKYFKGSQEAKAPLSKIKKLIAGEDISTSVSAGEFPTPDEIHETGKKAFALFSDGACRGNPGPGAWGAMGQNQAGDVLFESSGIEMSTTNNRMELQGGLEALKNIEEYLAGDTKETEIWLYSDSKYLVNGLIDWVPGWKKRGWKKADKKTPENLDLWQQLDEKRCQWGQYLKLRWVKGHSGHPQNERCDQLANEALDQTLGS